MLDPLPDSKMNLRKYTIKEAFDPHLESAGSLKPDFVEHLQRYENEVKETLYEN